MMKKIPQRLRAPLTLGLGRVSSRLLSTPSFLYDHFLTLSGWVETNEAEVNRKLLDPPAIGVVDITCKTGYPPYFYYGGILREVDLKGLNRITFRAKRNQDWRSVIGIDALKARDGDWNYVYTVYRNLTSEYKTFTIEKIGYHEPIDAIWITSSYKEGTKISVDMIRLEA